MSLENFYKCYKIYKELNKDANDSKPLIPQMLGYADYKAEEYLILQEHMLTPDEYVKMAVATESNDWKAIQSRLKNKKVVRLLHSLMGINTESGELMDQLKKHIFYGKELDIDNLKEEFGDSLWYHALGIDECEVGMEEIMKANIRKLKARYEGKFGETKALNRNLVKEKEALEGV